VRGTTEGSIVEYLLLTLSHWARDVGFDHFSGWHVLIVGGVMMLIAVLATR
jgi:hypothetical protein